jgi:hypothetical protein
MKKYLAITAAAAALIFGGAANAAPANLAPNPAVTQDAGAKADPVFFGIGIGVGPVWAGVGAYPYAYPYGGYYGYAPYGYYPRRCGYNRRGVWRCW